jgi:hypothetical protein
VVERDDASVMRDCNKRFHFFSLQNGLEFFWSLPGNREIPLPVDWSDRHLFLFNTYPNLRSQLRACLGLIEISQTFLRYSEAEIPSQRGRWIPKSLGSFCNAFSSPWAALGVTPEGLPDRRRSAKQLRPRTLASRIQATTVGRLNLRRLATLVDRHPLRTKSKAAIRIPAQAPGIRVACWRRFFSVTSR